MVGLGKRERDRIRALHTLGLNEASGPKAYTDEIAAERGVQLLMERGGGFSLFFTIPDSNYSLTPTRIPGQSTST